jgi:peptidoglycan hydrolase FlgJ
MCEEFYKQFRTILGLNCTKEVMGAKVIPLQQKVEFVFAYYPLAVEAGKVYTIHPLMLLAQACVESSWGTTELSKTCNNFFALANGKPNKFWSGESMQAEKGFNMKVYKSARDNFYDFAKLLREEHTGAADFSNSISQYANTIANNPHLPYTGKDKMLISKYKTLIIRTAISILEIAKVHHASHYN